MSEEAKALWLAASWEGGSANGDYLVQLKAQAFTLSEIRDLAAEDILARLNGETDDDSDPLAAADDPQ